MKKIFSENKRGDFFELVGDSHNHIAFSLRAHPGDRYVVCSGGKDYDCKVECVEKSRTILKILSSSPSAGEPNISVTLYFGILKGDKNEYVVQKCTELGTAAFVPFVSQNCECRPEHFKKERIAKIIASAAQQCGRGNLPVCGDVAPLEEVYKSFESYDRVIFPYERERAASAETVLKGIAPGENIAVIIGSEGGFTEEEAQKLIKAGARAVTLGDRILRAETASVAVVAAVMYEGGQWKIN